MKTSSGFMGGVATGLVVGATVAMITDPISSKQKKRMRKKTSGMFKTIGGVLDNTINMIR